MGYREGEQAEGSPHRYLTNEIDIAKGDIVVDFSREMGIGHLFQMGI